MIQSRLQQICFAVVVREKGIIPNVDYFPEKALFFIFPFAPRMAQCGVRRREGEKGSASSSPASRRRAVSRRHEHIALLGREINIYSFQGRGTRGQRQLHFPASLAVKRCMLRLVVMTDATVLNYWRTVATARRIELPTVPYACPYTQLYVRRIKRILRYDRDVTYSSRRLLLVEWSADFLCFAISFSSYTPYNFKLLCVCLLVTMQDSVLRRLKNKR